MLASMIALLSGLVNTDTTPPAHNETRAAEILDAFFRRCGVENTLHEPLPGRGSLVARIPGRSEESILVHTHLDTAAYETPVGVSSTRLVRKNGRLYGRGTLDCKGNAAVWAHVLCAMAQSGRTPQKTVLFAATADEETGGELGTKWLLEQTDVFRRVALVLGEGGGIPVPMGDKWLFTVQTGEMGLQKADGPGAPPSLEKQQALYRRAAVLGLYDETTLGYIRALPGLFGGRHIPQRHFYSGLAALLEAPEYARMPSSALYRRALPAISGVLRAMEHAWGAMPYIAPGQSDNRHFRAAGLPVLGFFPLHPGNRVGGIHGKGEYISEASLLLAYRCLSQVIRELAGFPA